MLTILVLGAGLVLPPVASYEAVYVTMIAALVLSGVVVTTDRSALGLPGFGLVVFATALMAIAALLSGPSALDWAGPGVVALLILSLGVLGVRLVMPRATTPFVIASLCLIGALFGAGLGAWEGLAGARRAGVGNNPIHYSGLVVILGFCSLSGFMVLKSVWRYVFFLGPFAAFVATFASGSRGPLLATLCLSVISWGLLLVWNRKDKVFWMVSAVLGLGGIVALAFFTDGARALSGLVIYLTGEAGVAANSDEIRQTLYLGGLMAFLDSPFWGHGYSNLMAATSQHMPAEERFTRFDHLHNDPIDFLVIAGALGGAAYLSVLGAPLTILRRIGDHRAAGPIVFAVMVSSSYLLLGMTNAMIGVLPQTVLFAVLLGCVLAFDRDLTTRADDN